MTPSTNPVFAALCIACLPALVHAQDAVIPRTLEPRASYVAYRIPSPLVIDGGLNDAAWSAAPWTADFVDIEGAVKAAPSLRTRVKMLWDDTYLYIAADMVEPDVWGTITKRDAVIFHDNDFEVFLDPDGDTHTYYELEINALGTVWDLALPRPYRDGGKARDDWNIDGLRSAVQVRGTLNRTGDVDDGWTVELALPWAALRERGSQPPRDGEQWRVNFSRVEWDADTVNGAYVKRNGSNGKPLPEHNWVWSPQGAINMHMPERWGTVQFSAKHAAAGVGHVRADADEYVRDGLRSVYYAQRLYRERHGVYASDLVMLQSAALRIPGTPLSDVVRAGARMTTTPDGYRATMQGADGAMMLITQDGRIRRDS